MTSAVFHAAFRRAQHRVEMVEHLAHGCPFFLGRLGSVGARTHDTRYRLLSPVEVQIEVARRHVVEVIEPSIRLKRIVWPHIVEQRAQHDAKCRDLIAVPLDKLEGDGARLLKKFKTLLYLASHSRSHGFVSGRKHIARGTK